MSKEESKEKNNDDFLYHYTTLENCIKILESSMLLLTRCDHTKNAEHEIEPVRSALAQIQDNEMRQRNINKWEKRRQNSYVVSFSKHDDNEHLWEEYADGHKGVVIAFKQSWLPGSRKPDTAVEEDKLPQSFRQIDMCYNSEIEFINSVVSLGKSEFEPLTYHNIDAFKCKKYENEDETRLIYFNSDFPTILNPVDYKHSEEGTSYFLKPLSLSLILGEDLRSIEKIYCFKPEVKHKIEALLHGLGHYCIRVTLVDSPTP